VIGVSDVREQIALVVFRAAGGGTTADGKPSTIRWRSDVRDNSGPDSTMKAGNSGGRRKWSIRSGRNSGGGGGSRGGSALLGHLEDDDLDCDLFDDELDFRHQHDTTSVYTLHASDVY